MFRLKRKVQYYETDAMQVVHHSNYIRWFEEIRLQAMEEMGTPYPMLEEMGFICPVLTVNCEYHKSARFGCTVEIRAALTENRAVRSSWVYAIVDADTNELYACGTSTHCFLQKGAVVSLKKECPEVYETMNRFVSNETVKDLKAAMQ